jgi:asparagine synthase (glutamine-hydrolysing)
MLARYIARFHPDIKVVVAGEGSDELLGYVYLKMAPNQVEFQKETEKLTHNIHLFDGIRADRCISHYGLEARFPFLDEHFVRTILSLPPVVKMHTDIHREKWILREAFSQLMPTLLPNEILWRPKAAMSDATSSMERSWFTIIQEYIASLSLVEKTPIYPITHMVPPTEEATYFRVQWQKHFPEKASHVIPYYWLPNQEWCPDAKDPSARTLSFYHGEKD